MEALDLGFHIAEVLIAGARIHCFSGANESALGYCLFSGCIGRIFHCFHSYNPWEFVDSIYLEGGAGKLKSFIEFFLFSHSDWQCDV